jgi:hypothetical protein
MKVKQCAACPYSLMATVGRTKKAMLCGYQAEGEAKKEEFSCLPVAWIKKCPRPPLSERLECPKQRSNGLSADVIMEIKNVIFKG